MSRTVRNTLAYRVHLFTLGLHLDPGEAGEVPDDAILPAYLHEEKHRPTKAVESTKTPPTEESQ